MATATPEPEPVSGVTAAVRDLSKAVGALSRALTKEAVDTTAEIHARSLRSVSHQLNSTAAAISGTADQVETRRTKRRVETVDEILAATRRVIAAKGYTGASVADIAAEANFTKGAVYASFPSKEALFLAAAQRQSEEQLAALTSFRDAGAAPENWRDLSRCSESSDIVFSLETLLFGLRNPEARDHTEQSLRDSLAVTAEIIARSHRRDEPSEDDHTLAFIVTATFSLASMIASVIGEDETAELNERTMRILFPDMTETTEKPGD